MDSGVIVPVEADSLSAESLQSMLQAAPVTDSVPFVFQPVHGMMGTPLPYTVRGDNIISGVLLFCLILFIIAVARTKRYIVQQLKDFFYPSRGELRDFQFPLTSFNLFLVAVNCIMLAIGSLVFVSETVTDMLIIDSRPLVVAILAVAFGLYFLLKRTAYWVVNTIFLGSKKRLQWDRSFLFLVAMEGVLMIPMVMLLVYFDLSVKIAIYYCGFVLLLNKMLTFYKVWCIFFNQTGRFLQTFLYFCALEITPLLAFSGLWMVIIDKLKVNF